jgi:hypothetical protein
MPADQAAARTERVLGAGVARFAEDEAARAAREARWWEADVVPLIGSFSETGEAGSIALVLADGLVLASEILGRRPAGASARAAAVLDVVSAGARKTGVFPARLHVRDEALADALRPDAEARGITPAAEHMPALDEAVDDALAHVMRSPAGGAASSPWTWAETEASADELAELHAAAADYHRASPWRTMGDGDAMLLAYPGDDTVWGASVMGGAGILTGLALYSEPQDLDTMLNAGQEDPDVRVPAMRGLSLSISYDGAADLSRAMRREVASAGWELAAPDAYPTLMGIRVPGRRITPELVRRASMACRAVAAFVRAGDVSLPWRDPATGVSVDFVYAPDPWDAVEPLRLPWPGLETCHVVGPAGRKADPQAALRDPWEAVRDGEVARLRRFTAWLKKQQPSKAAWNRLLWTAEAWARALIGYRVPAQSATEYDLRLFLYTYLCEHQTPSKAVARHLTRSLERIFAFYAEREGIEYPWARDVLHELDGMCAGAEDVRDVLRDAAPHLPVDMIVRALRPSAEVSGTIAGWTVAATAETAELRNDLHRHWLIWHDEVVRGGITDPDEVRALLIPRQRQWENTARPELDGRTPSQVLMDTERQAAELLAAVSHFAAQGG